VPEQRPVPVPALGEGGTEAVRDAVRRGERLLAEPALAAGELDGHHVDAVAQAARPGTVGGRSGARVRQAVEPQPERVGRDAPRREPRTAGRGPGRVGGRSVGRPGRRDHGVFAPQIRPEGWGRRTASGAGPCRSPGSVRAVAGADGADADAAGADAAGADAAGADAAGSAADGAAATGSGPDAGGAGASAATWDSRASASSSDRCSISASSASTPEARSPSCPPAGTRAAISAARASTTGVS